METFLLLFVCLVVFGWIIGIKDWLGKRAAQERQKQETQTTQRIRALVGTEGDDEERNVLTYILQCKLRGLTPSCMYRYGFPGEKALQLWLELDSQFELQCAGRIPASTEAFVARWRERWRELKEASRLAEASHLAETDKRQTENQLKQQRRKAVKKAKEEIILHLADKIRTDGRICP